MRIKLHLRLTQNFLHLSRDVEYRRKRRYSLQSWTCTSLPEWPSRIFTAISCFSGFATRTHSRMPPFSIWCW